MAGPFNRGDTIINKYYYFTYNKSAADDFEIIYAKVWKLSIKEK